MAHNIIISQYNTIMLQHHEAHCQQPAAGLRPAGRRRTRLEQGTQPVTGIQLFSF
jgi:hypothetical protein